MRARTSERFLLRAFMPRSSHLSALLHAGHSSSRSFKSLSGHKRSPACSLTKRDIRRARAIYMRSAGIMNFLARIVRAMRDDGLRVRLTVSLAACSIINRLSPRLLLVCTVGTVADVSRKCSQRESPLGKRHSTRHTSLLATSRLPGASICANLAELNFY